MLFDVKSSGSVAYLNLANELMNKDLNAGDGFRKLDTKKPRIIGAFYFEQLINVLIIF